MLRGLRRRAGGHGWQFYRAGGVDQVRLDRGEDILRIGELDQKLWVALGCPANGLEFDERTLELIDADHDGQVRPQELIATAQWLGEVLANPDELVAGDDGVPLTSIRDDTEEGRSVRAAALHLLAVLGKQGAAAVTIADATRAQGLFTMAKANGDGVVTAAAVDAPAVRQLVEEVIACVGAVTDKSGAPGVDAAKLEQFLAACAAFDGWWQLAETDSQNILPLGQDTLAAASAFEAVRAKVDDYFARCRLASYDERALPGLNGSEAAYLEVGMQPLSLAADEVARFPLALVAAGKPLPLRGAVNPHWAARLCELNTRCIAPLLDGERLELTDAEWLDLHARLAAHRLWLQKQAGGAVAPLGLARVRQILREEARVALARAIAEDQAAATLAADVTKVEKLVRLYRDFRRLLTNFVSFSEFYARRGSMFQAGTLYLDGRACELCVRVNDASKHAPLAAMSGMYLVYADCMRAGGERLHVVAALTAGDSDNLFVGRHGVFYDRKGRDWSATVTKIIDNPISIRQAFWSPYKKVARWIEEQIARRAAASDAASHDDLRGALTAAGDAASGKAPSAKPKIDIGVVAALGVAVGGITAALGALLESFFGLGWWMPLGVLGLLLCISGPSMIMAGMKLRRRNLGPILDASGWAVNVMAKINIPLGTALTTVADIPAGSSRSLVDPYAPKKALVPRVAFALVALGVLGAALYKTGQLHTWWPQLPLPRPVAAAAPDAPRAVPDAAPDDRP